MKGELNEEEGEPYEQRLERPKQLEQQRRRAKLVSARASLPRRVDVRKYRTRRRSR